MRKPTHRCPSSDSSRGRRRYAEAGLAGVELAEGRALAALARARRLLDTADPDPVGPDAELVAELRCTIALALAATRSDEAEVLALGTAALAGLERISRPHACIDPLRDLVKIP